MVARADSEVSWASLSRALRSAHGLAQEDWAGWLDVSRKTVQRWERGLGAPDDRVEARLAAFCAERDVFERVRRGALRVGVRDWPELVDVLLLSRRARQPRAASPRAANHELFGRDADLAAVHTLLTRHQLVTITGPGGVGKTSVAHAALHGWSGDAVFVELAPVRDVDLVLAEIGARIDVSSTGAAVMRDVVVAAIAERSLLLVLDNLEHLPAAAPLVGDLVASCPQARILITSRTPLHLREEVEYRLAALPADQATSPAVALFVARACVADPRFAEGAEERALVRDICARLDGLPLAIELAAARLRAISVRDLHARIDRSLALLSGGDSDRPLRQQSMRDSLSWSDDLLSADEKRLLRSLSWFVGGWSLDAAESVGSGTAVLDLVNLVDSCLVARDGERYRMPETVREYVVESNGEAGANGALFVAWATSFAEENAEKLRGAHQRDALAAVDVEIANMRAAMQCCLHRSDAHAAHRLAIALAGFWDSRSLLGEARRWLELTQACAGAHPLARATVLNWLAYFCGLQRDLAPAERHAKAALTLWTEHGIEAGVGYARLVLGRVAAERGEFDTAIYELHDAMRRLRSTNDRWGLVRPINALGEIAREMGDLDEASARHAEALALCRDLGEEGSLPSILADVAHVALEQGDPAAARDAADEALVIATRLGNAVGVASALDALGRCLLAEGDVGAAAEVWGESDALRRDLGHPVERRDQGVLRRERQIARDLLGEDAFVARWTRGTTRAPYDRT